jgi:diguanylate cyclase (GGDEF)-like protein
MTRLLQRWIVRTVESGRCLGRRDVLRFAVVRTFWTTLAAVMLNFGVYQILGRLGFLGVIPPPDPLSDTIVTAFVAAPISLLVYSIFGTAIRDLTISHQLLERLSRTDPLTGLLNRRAFMEHIDSLDSPYVLVLLDIDRFKAINDRYGHGTGDQILVALADMLKCVVDSQVVARLGGEEFGAVFCGVDRDQVLATMDALREKLASRIFEFEGREVRVTFSAGIAESDGQVPYSTLHNLGDKALYLAKASGRNRIVLADEAAPALLAGAGLPDRRAR